MFTDYPELREIEEFKALKNPQDLAFTWWYSSPTSDLRNIPGKADKIEKCIKAAYKSISKEKKENLIYGEMPPPFVNAIRRWETFNPSARLLVRGLDHNQLKQFEAILAKSPEAIKSMETNEQLDYFRMTKVINDQLVDVLKRVESQYGISEEKSIFDEKSDNTLTGLVMEEED